MKKHIVILNTGGTISCVQTPTGLQPASQYVETFFKDLPALQHPDLPTYHFHEYDPLLDSSNMTPDSWNQLVDSIEKYYNSADGFVIFHGTDTMAYTASALSFMLENLGKPVILTGSQLPLGDVRSDAIENTITALLLCARYTIPEVCIYFNKMLLRGNRARKLHTHRFDAFHSPNYSPLAYIGIHLEVRADKLLPLPTAPFQIQHCTPHPIAMFRFFPGFCLKTVEALLQLPLRALILETYGAGNAPNVDVRLFQLLKKAEERGMLILNATQCVEGRVDMAEYATGQALREAGVLSAVDMTPEALHAKLLYACSKTQDIHQLRHLMQTTLCGEKSA